MARRRSRDEHDIGSRIIIHDHRSNNLNRDEFFTERGVNGGRAFIPSFEDGGGRRRSDSFSTDRRPRTDKFGGRPFSRTYNARRYRRRDFPRARRSNRNFRGRSMEREWVPNPREPQPLPCVITTVVPGESDVSEISYRCNFCHFATNDKQLVSLHINDHLFRCSLCSFYTDRQHELLRHKHLAHDKPHPLPYELLAIDGNLKSHDKPKFTVVAEHQLFDVATPKCPLPDDFYVSNVIVPDLCETGILDPTPVAKADISLESYPLQDPPLRCAAEISDNVNFQCGATDGAVCPRKPVVEKVKMRIRLKSNKVKRKRSSRHNVEEIFVAERTTDTCGVVAPKFLTPSLKLLSTYMDTSEPTTATPDVSDVDCPMLSARELSSRGVQYAAPLLCGVDVHQATSLKAVEVLRLVASAGTVEKASISQTVIPLQTLSILSPLSLVTPEQSTIDIEISTALKETRQHCQSAVMADNISIPSGHLLPFTFSSVTTSTSCHLDVLSHAAVRDSVLSVATCENLMQPVEVTGTVQLAVPRKAKMTKSPPLIKMSSARSSTSRSVMEGLRWKEKVKVIVGPKNINRISSSFSDESLHAAGTSIDVLGPSLSLPEVSTDFNETKNMLSDFTGRRRNLRRLPSRQAALCEERRALSLANAGKGNAPRGLLSSKSKVISNFWQGPKQPTESDTVKDGSAVASNVGNEQSKSTTLKEKVPVKSSVQDKLRLTTSNEPSNDTPTGPELTSITSSEPCDSALTGPKQTSITCSEPCDSAPTGSEQTLMTSSEHCDSAPTGPKQTLITSSEPCDGAPTGPEQTSMTSSEPCDSALTGPKQTSMTSSEPGDSALTGPKQTSITSSEPCDNAPTGPKQTLITSSEPCDSALTGPKQTSITSSEPCDSAPTGPEQTSMTSSEPGDSALTGPKQTSITSSEPCDSAPTGPEQTSMTSSEPCDSALTGPKQTSITSSEPCDGTPTGPKHLDLYAFEERNDQLDIAHWNIKSGSRPGSSHSNREDEIEDQPSSSSVPSALLVATSSAALAGNEHACEAPIKTTPNISHGDDMKDSNEELRNSPVRMLADLKDLENEESKPLKVTNSSVLHGAMKTYTRSPLKRPLQRPCFIQPPNLNHQALAGEKMAKGLIPSLASIECDQPRKSPSLTRSISLNSASSISLSSTSQTSTGLTISPQSSFVSVASKGKAADSVSGVRGNKRRRISAPSTDGPRRRAPTRETRERALIKQALSTLLVCPPANKRARPSLYTPEGNLTFMDLSDAETIPDCLLNIPTRHLTPSPVRQLLHRAEPVQILLVAEESVPSFSGVVIVHPVVTSRQLSTGNFTRFNRIYSRNRSADARQSNSHGEKSTAKRDEICLVERVSAPKNTVASLSMLNYAASALETGSLESVEILTSVRKVLPKVGWQETVYSHCELSEISALECLTDVDKHLKLDTHKPTVNDALLVSYSTADVSSCELMLEGKYEKELPKLQKAECVDLATGTDSSPVIDCIVISDQTADTEARLSTSCDSSIGQFPVDSATVESELSSEIATVGDFSACDTESETSPHWDSSIEVTGEYALDTDICVVDPPHNTSGEERIKEHVNVCHTLTVVQAKVAPVIVQAEECATTVEPSLSPSLSSPTDVHEVVTFTAHISRSHSESPISDHRRELDNAEGSKIAGTSYCGLKSKLQLAVQKGALEKKPTTTDRKPHSRKESKRVRSSSTSKSLEHLKSDDSKLRKKKKQKKKHKRKHKESRPELSAPKLPLEHPVSPIGVSHSCDKSAKLIHVHSKASCKRHKKESVSQEGGLIFYPVPSESRDINSKSKAGSSEHSVSSANHKLSSEEKKRKSPDLVIHSKHKKIKLNNTKESSQPQKTNKKPREHNSKKSVSQKGNVFSPSQPKPPWFNNKTITDVIRCDMCDFICLELNDLVEHKEEIHAVKNMAPKLAPCDYDPPVDVNVQYKCTLCGLSDDHLKRIRHHISSEHGSKLKTCERVTHTRAETGFSLKVETVRVYRQ